MEYLNNVIDYTYFFLKFKFFYGSRSLRGYKIVEAIREADKKYSFIA